MLIEQNWSCFDKAASGFKQMLYGTWKETRQWTINVPLTSCRADAYPFCVYALSAKENQ